MKTPIVVVLMLLVWQPVQKQQLKPKPDSQQSQQLPSPAVPAAAPIPSKPETDPQQNSSNAQPGETLCSRLADSLISNWPLVGIGLLGIVVAWLTLKDIHTQAEETAKAAQATSKGVEAVIRSERAWVIAELVQTGIRRAAQWHRWNGRGKRVPMSEDEIYRGEHLQQSLRFINMGRTVAHISAYQIHVGLWDHKKEKLKIYRISNKGDIDQMLAGSEATEMLPEEIIDIHEFAANPAAEIDTWKNWLVILVMVGYQHVFSGLEIESEVFRFVYDPKKMNVKRAPTTEADKKQAREPEILPWPPSAT